MFHSFNNSTGYNSLSSLSTTLYAVLARYSFEYHAVASEIISLYDKIVTGPFYKSIIHFLIATGTDYSLPTNYLGPKIRSSIVMGSS